jgi:hypothetical protein
MVKRKNCRKPKRCNTCFVGGSECGGSSFFGGGGGFGRGRKSSCGFGGGMGGLFGNMGFMGGFGGGGGIN